MISREHSYVYNNGGREIDFLASMDGKQSGLKLFDMEKSLEVVAALIWEKNKFLICQRPANKARDLLW